MCVAGPGAAANTYNDPLLGSGRRGRLPRRLWGRKGEEGRSHRGRSETGFPDGGVLIGEVRRRVTLTCGTVDYRCQLLDNASRRNLNVASGSRTVRECQFHVDGSIWTLN